jgi:hypothetical protein
MPSRSPSWQTSRECLHDLGVLLHELRIELLRAAIRGPLRDALEICRERRLLRHDAEHVHRETERARELRVGGGEARADRERMLGQPCFEVAHHVFERAEREIRWAVLEPACARGDARIEHRVAVHEHREVRRAPRIVETGREAGARERVGEVDRDRGALGDDDAAVLDRRHLLVGLDRAIALVDVLRVDADEVHGVRHTQLLEQPTRADGAGVGGVVEDEFGLGCCHARGLRRRRDRTCQERAQGQLLLTTSRQVSAFSWPYSMPSNQGRTRSAPSKPQLASPSPFASMPSSKCRCG